VPAGRDHRCDDLYGYLPKGRPRTCWNVPPKSPAEIPQDVAMSCPKWTPAEVSTTYPRQKWFKRLMLLMTVWLATRCCHASASAEDVTNALACGRNGWTGYCRTAARTTAADRRASMFRKMTQAKKRGWPTRPVVISQANLWHRARWSAHGLGRCWQASILGGHLLDRRSAAHPCDPVIFPHLRIPTSTRRAGSSTAHPTRL